MSTPMTTEQAAAVWEVLVEECGATVEHGFVYHQSTDFCGEFRFMGKLGFGGKFRRNVSRRPDGQFGELWYVDCYPEDETPDRLRRMTAANRRLWDMQQTAEATA